MQCHLIIHSLSVNGLLTSLIRLKKMCQNFITNLEDFISFTSMDQSKLHWFLPGPVKWWERCAALAKDLRIIIKLTASIYKYNMLSPLLRLCRPVFPIYIHSAYIYSKVIDNVLSSTYSMHFNSEISPTIYQTREKSTLIISGYKVTL